MKYVYPAIFYKEKSGGYSVIFPDVEGVITQGETLYEAMEMAEDALSLMLVEYEEYKGKMKNRIIEPTPIENVKADINESSTSAFVVLIKSDTDSYRQKYDNSKHELWHSENTNKSFSMLKNISSEKNLHNEKRDCRCNASNPSSKRGPKCRFLFMPKPCQLAGGYLKSGFCYSSQWAILHPPFKSDSLILM